MWHHHSPPCHQTAHELGTGDLPRSHCHGKGEEEEEGAEEKEGWKGRLREGGGNLGDHERKLGLGWEWKVKGVEVVGG